MVMMIMKRRRRRSRSRRGNEIMDTHAQQWGLLGMYGSRVVNY